MKKPKKYKIIYISILGILLVIGFVLILINTNSSNEKDNNKINNLEQNEIPDPEMPVDETEDEGYIIVDKTLEG